MANILCIVLYKMSRRKIITIDRPYSSAIMLGILQMLTAAEFVISAEFLRDLLVSSALTVTKAQPKLAATSAQQFVERMNPVTFLRQEIFLRLRFPYQHQRNQPLEIFAVTLKIPPSNIKVI